MRLQRSKVCLLGLLVCLVLAGMAWAGMRVALRQASTTTYTPLSGEAEWEGDWEFSELGADPSQAGRERVTIPFAGTDLALRVRRGDYRAYLFVSVDGQPANRLPREERGAYLVLTSPDYASQVVIIPVASGLEDGLHVAIVTAERGWDQWPLVGWSASRTPDTTLYCWALAGLGVLALACLAGAIGVQHPVSSIQHLVSSILHPPSSILRLVSRIQSPISNLHPLASNLQPPTSIFLVVILASAAVLYFSPWPVLTLAGGLVLAAFILLRLDLGLALVAATAPFYLYPRPLLGKSFTMAEIVILLCVASWGLRRLLKPPISNLQSPTSNLQPLSSLDRAALLFVLAASASLLVAEYRHVALRELRVVVLEPALFYLLLRTSQLQSKAVWRIVDSFVLGAAVVALIGLVQYGLGVNVITAEEGFRRLRSVYGSPNNAGLYLGRVLPVLVAIALFGAARGRRVAYGLAIVPVGLAILLSFSKGALILGVPLSLVAVGLLAGGPWPWASLGSVVVAALVAISLLRTPRFASLLDIRGGTTFFRLNLWRSSWMMFRDHPWFGVGLDNFLYQYRSRYILPAAWQEPGLSHPHNVLLDYASRLGLVGLVAGLWMQIAFWWQALPLRRLADPDQRALALGLMGSMVSFLAHGLVDASYFVIDLAFAFFLALGVIQWLARSGTDGIET